MISSALKSLALVITLSLTAPCLAVCIRDPETFPDLKPRTPLIIDFLAPRVIDEESLFKLHDNLVTFKVLKATSMKMAVFWDVD
jgi:hypothetical protein